MKNNIVMQTALHITNNVQNKQYQQILKNYDGLVKLKYHKFLKIKYFYIINMSRQIIIHLLF